MGACGEVRGQPWGLVALLLLMCWGSLLGVDGADATWRWNQFVTSENSDVPDPPQYVTKLNNDIFNLEKHKYIIEGEGVGDIFTVQDAGDIYVIGLLDRETKSQYHLTARMVDKLHNGQNVVAPAPFTISIGDINDNDPVFNGPYEASVQEMSTTGTEVMVINATDADDGNTENGRIRFTLLNGTEFFTIIERGQGSGTIKTKVSNLDRETTPEYKILVQASDGGKNAVHSVQTVVTIRIKDINDNMSTFKDANYRFTVPEDVSVHSIIGHLQIEDKDTKDNKNPIFKIDAPQINNLLEIKLNKEKNGELFLKQALDYETQSSYSFPISVTENIVPNVPQNPRAIQKANVVIIVTDVDEAPVFDKAEYNIQVEEEKFPFVFREVIKARDPDTANLPIRYSVEESCPIAIDPKEGVLSLRVKLDREYKPLHKCQVTAAETLPGGGEGLKSHVLLNLDVLDINDHAPKLSTEEVDVCESDKPGTIVATLGAIDNDEMSKTFTFRLAKPSSNFSLSDTNNGTAILRVKQGGFRTEDSSDHVLEVEVADGRSGGPGVLKSVERLRIKVCTCGADRTPEYCRPHRRAVGVSMHALITILLCIVTILVIVILLVLRQRYRKDSLVALGKSSAGSEIHEQLVTYDEEGGGEMDTNGYDVSILTSARHDGSLQLPSHTPTPGVYARVNKQPPLALGAAKGDMAAMIEVKKDEADHDRDGGPYDTLHIYGYEGPGSLAGSLSSLESDSSGADSEDYDFLSEWGPRFRTLAELYGVDGYAGGLPY
ncbi:cadherin-5 [Engraulis encrasicolus]|uniref:cadherin-5 n=1 Tax=Engraulis encrasicolus TaxID=184585 RepID=UPI002FD02B76